MTKRGARAMAGRLGASALMAVIMAAQPLPAVAQSESARQAQAAQAALAQAQAKAQAQAGEAQAVGTAMNTFYRAAKKPDVGGLIARWEQLAASDEPNALPPMVGFLSAYFEQNPKEVERTLGHKLGRKGQTVALIALKAAGNDTAIQQATKRWRWSDADTAKLDGVKPLSQLVASSASDLDTLWGAAFATGDPAYVRKIYAFFASIANDAKIEPGDIVRVVEARRKNRPDGLRGIGERYPAAVAQQIIVAASAAWSLLANAALHPFVQAELDRIEKEAPDSNGVKAIIAMRQPD